MRWQLGNGMIEVIIASSMLVSAGLYLFHGQLQTLTTVERAYDQSVDQLQKFNRSKKEAVWS